jgi:signal transduction histidine kinase
LTELARALFDADAQALHERVETSDDRTLQIVGLPPLAGDETAVLVIADLTAEEERSRSQREFVANAAHQLRTPLTTILTAVEVLRDGADADPEARSRFLDHVEREASRLARLTRALLVLARAQVREEAPRSEQLRVLDLLDAVAGAVRPQDGVSIEVSCPADLIAFGELDLMEQALVNVVENSAKHTAEGVIRLSGRRQGNQTAVEIEDSGCGMDSQTRQRAFDRFYRGNARERNGFGLGLAIVREAVETMGGSVSIESALGRGTTTRILLPSAPPA